MTARSYLVGYIYMYLFDVATYTGRSTPTTRHERHEGHRRNDRDGDCMCERALFSDRNEFLSALAESRGERSGSVLETRDRAASRQWRSWNVCCPGWTDILAPEQPNLIFV